MPTYVNGDIRSIQEYVFASPRLLEMRGASALIGFFERQVVRRLASDYAGDVIFAGGGNFMVCFSDENESGRAAGFVEAARTAFLDLTGGHGLAVAKVSSDLPFREALGEMRQQLRRVKRQPSEPRQLASMPFLKRCDSCGRETADEVFRRPGAPPEAPPMWLGPACARKRRMAAELREAGKRRRAARQSVYLLPVSREEELKVPEVIVGLAGPEQPSDFQELVGDDDLAIVCADGNNLGEWFEDLEREPFQELSETVDRALREAVDGAERAVLGEGHKQRQILICGGDDLVVALPGRFAFSFARELLTRFRVTHPVPGDGRTTGLAVGLIFSRVGFPFRQAHRLATELLCQAKARCRPPESLPWALAFHRVLGSHVQSAAREQAALERHDGGAHGWSYGAAGPYGAEDLEALFELKRWLESGVSPSQKGRLREILSPRDDGPHTPLDPQWKVPSRVLDELRAWLARQVDEEPPFRLPPGCPPQPKLVRQVPVAGGTRVFQRFILADALALAGAGEVD